MEQLCPYEEEYNEVVQVMSRICRHIVYNNSNQARKLKIDEQEIIELMPRIWALSTDHQKQAKEI